MPRIPGSLVACRSTASASARVILSSAAANRADPDESPFNRASYSFLRHASLWVCCRPCPGPQVPAPKTPFTETPHRSKSSLRRYVLATSLYIKTSPRGRSGTIFSGSLHSDLNVGRVATAVWGPRDCSHSEYSIGVPSFRLRKYSSDIPSTCFDRRPLLGDKHWFR